MRRTRMCGPRSRRAGTRRIRTLRCKPGWGPFCEIRLRTESFACWPIRPELLLRREIAPGGRRLFSGRRKRLCTPERRLNRGQLCIHRLLSANVLQLRFEFAIGSFTQVFELFGFQFAHFAGLDVENEWSVTHAADLFDVMPDLFEHLAQLAVAAFDDDDFVPRIVALANFTNLRRRSLHFAGAGLTPLNANA